MRGQRLQRGDFTTGFITTSRELTTDTKAAVVDWHAAITALQAGRLPCSGGEGSDAADRREPGRRHPIDLRDALTGLDTHNASLVLQAVRHATGQPSRTATPG